MHLKKYNHHRRPGALDGENNDEGEYKTKSIYRPFIYLSAVASPNEIDERMEDSPGEMIPRQMNNYNTEQQIINSVLIPSTQIPPTSGVDYAAQLFINQHIQVPFSMFQSI